MKCYHQILEDSFLRNSSLEFASTLRYKLLAFAFGDGVVMMDSLLQSTTPLLCYHSSLRLLLQPPCHHDPGSHTAVMLLEVKALMNQATNRERISFFVYIVLSFFLLQFFVFVRLSL